jgi:ABC-type uncharacterized transport system auxiliary subunit
MEKVFLTVYGTLFRIVVAALFCLGFLGCAGTGKPLLQMESYLIDYPSPVFEKSIVIDETIRIDRFRVAGAYNHRAMVIRRDYCVHDSFNYNRWAVHPSDMIGDMLLRDMQASGLFRAVFPFRALDEGRYLLQGGLEELFFRMDGSGPVAVVSLELTLKDTSRREATKRILFQKKYRDEQPLETASPKGYCKATSLAVKRLSRRITADVYQTLLSASAP